MKGKTVATLRRPKPPLGGLADARYFHTATLLNNGIVLIVGGAGAGDAPVGQAELY